MLKIGIIGAGNISGAHIDAYKAFPERCQIIAVCDIYRDKALEKIEQYGLREAHAYSEPKELMDLDLDLVSICTPPYTHAQLSMDFMHAGSSVLIEKPMASSLEECDQMNRAAEETGKILSVVAQNRYRTPMMKLKSVLDSGMMGRIVHVQVDSFWWRGHSYYDLWWRGTWEKEGGGCTLNHAVHHIDAMLWMMGMPLELTALMGNTAHDNAEVEDLSMALLRFPQGALGQLTSSVVHHGEEQQLIFQGTDARVSFPWKLCASSSKPNGFPENNPELEKEIQNYYDSLPDLTYELHTGQVENVLKVLNGEEELLLDGMSGKAALELIMGIYSSSVSGRAVELPLSADNPFYSKESALKAAPHFYEKNASIEKLPDEYK